MCCAGPKSDDVNQLAVMATMPVKEPVLEAAPPEEEEEEKEPYVETRTPVVDWRTILKSTKRIGSNPSD